MKLIRLIAVLLVFFCSKQAVCQEKWRTLSVSAITGTNFNNNSFNTIASSFHWDFNKDYFFTNWTGFQVQHNSLTNSWFTSQSTVNRYIGNWVVGAGMQYGLASNPGVFQMNNRTTFAITSVSYRWKFGKK